MYTTVKKLKQDIRDVLADIPVDFGGGCSVSKATVMSYIVKSQNIQKSIDIGIYKGRSFLPQAFVHKHYTGGVVYGVDPYTNQAAIEHDHKELAKEIKDFANTTDFEKLFKTVSRKIKSKGLEDHASIVRMTSNDAVATLSKDGTKYGLIHIDGNHDTHAVIDDINNYLPLLGNNGFIVLDDISWRSVRPAVDLVRKQMTLLYERVDTPNDYAVFWNGKSRSKTFWLRHMLAIAGEGED